MKKISWLLLLAVLWMPLNAFAEKTVSLTMRMAENTDTAKQFEKMLTKRLSALNDVVFTEDIDKSDMVLNMVVLEQKTGSYIFSYIVAYSAYKLCKFNYVAGIYAPTLEQLVNMTVENIKEQNLKPYRESKTGTIIKEKDDQN